jgi:hypothetical protein
VPSSLLSISSTLNMKAYALTKLRYPSTSLHDVKTQTATIRMFTYNLNNKVDIHAMPLCIHFRPIKKLRIHERVR